MSRNSVYSGEVSVSQDGRLTILILGSEAGNQNIAYLDNESIKFVG